MIPFSEVIVKVVRLLCIIETTIFGTRTKCKHDLKKGEHILIIWFYRAAFRIILDTVMTDLIYSHHHNFRLN